jgi:hypothetical protein
MLECKWMLRGFYGHGEHVPYLPCCRREEIVNACGVDDFHDGVNYMRTACVIAVSRARDMFEPFVHQVRCPQRLVVTGDHMPYSEG